MSHLPDIYKTSLGTLTDLYQLTMACGYWKAGMHEREGVFHLFFRKPPFGGGFAIAAGLARAEDYLVSFGFDTADLDHLAGLRGNDGNPLFEEAFLDHLRELRPAFDIDALPEGTAVFPGEPLLRVRGPILQGQIVETALLNMINFETLVATKAARVCLAAEGEPVLEFGLRRAQGIDGGLAASRAAYLGGCAATSNVLAGRLFGIPVKGTHAHSWVMSFEDEQAAFDEYARAMPNNCIFLVDTYDTLEGVRKAVATGLRLRERGHEMLGIRLDSGDLAWLSIEARKLLDEAGFPDAAIVASNDLDEHIIESLKRQGARITVWGVGTKLVTSYDQPALGGVYKLSALRSPGDPWRYTVKLSEQAVKISNPGILQVRRFERDGEFAGDMILNEEAGPGAPPWLMRDPIGGLRTKSFDESFTSTDLLEPVFRGGGKVRETPTLAASRARAADQIARLPAGTRRFLNPHQYPVGLESGLYDLRSELIRRAGGMKS